MAGHLIGHSCFFLELLVQMIFFAIAFKKLIQSNYFVQF
ncbi:hypothetical protein O203_15885 [Ectopseudomonas chengduensis]|nr:hypothetical protein O203_15885 [Pseudomonas chengduensis]